jgi:predicted amidohydrolase
VHGTRKEKLVVGVAQWLPLPGRPRDNLETALGFIHELARRGCELIVLPELWPVGLHPATFRDDAAAGAEPLDGPRLRALADAARELGIWLAAGSVPEAAAGGVYNTAPLFGPDGRPIAAHRKCHLYTALGEHRAYLAGTTLTVGSAGELGTVGISICFDGDFPEVARTMRRRGARLVVHPSAYELAAASWWDTLYPANALTNGQWWVLANQCGQAGSVTYLGASRVISPDGAVVATAGRAAEGETPRAELLVAAIDLAEGLERADRENAALWRDARPELYTA